MKITKILYSASLSIMFLAVISLARCADSDYALVTLHIPHNGHAKAETVRIKTIADKIHDILFTPAFAWTDTRDRYTLTVTAGDMEDIDLQVSPDVTVISVEVPAGPNREISFYTEEIQVNNGSYLKNWGGRTILSLDPGQETDITLKMIPITRVYAGNDGWNYISIETVYSTNAQAYRLYRARSQAGPYTLLTIIPQDTGNTYQYYTDMDVVPGSYFYKVSVTGPDGEGILSDPSDETVVF